MNLYNRGDQVTNHRTGETGTFIAAWVNYAGQIVANVTTTSGMKASWVIAGGAVMSAFQPHAGQIYGKSYTNKVQVLVITPIDRICNNGWFCLGLPIFRDGSYGRPMLVSVHADDVLCERVRLPKVAALALRRHRAIQRRRHAAYVADESYEKYEGGQILYIHGGD